MADGLIVIGTTLNQSAWHYFKGIATNGRAVATWGGPEIDPQALSCDNAGGAALATEHLIDRGCRKIVFIGPVSPAQPQFYERYTGFAATMAAHKLVAINAPQVSAASRDAHGYDCVRELIAKEIAFDGIFAASDPIAIGALRALHDQRRRVPDDVAVVGFDNIPAAKSYTPSLSSVEPDYLQAGKLLVESVCSQMAGEVTELARVPVRLFVRDSSR